MHAVLPVAQQAIVEPLLNWFKATNRRLPWRETYDPYHIWISEVMLQQTQMDRGVAYFRRWIGRFPDVRSVAEAEEQDILKYWEGLGYYARARNLHRAARQLVERFGSQVPCDYHALLTLPGIGPYTAAAIASVAGNQDVPVIDANVTRVYARVADLAGPVKARQQQRLLRQIAEHLLPKGQARSFNQALMDLGGLVCTPRNPRCTACPLAVCCLALKAGTVDERPMVGDRKSRVTLHRVGAFIVWNGRIFIQQRSPDAVWGSLWEFPGGETQGKKPAERVVAAVLEETGLPVSVERALTTVVHQYTHHKVILHCYLCRLTAPRSVPVLNSASAYRWVAARELDRFAFPAGPRKLLEYLKAAEPELLRG